MVVTSNEDTFPHNTVLRSWNVISNSPFPLEHGPQYVGQPVRFQGHITGILSPLNTLPH